MGFSQEDVLEQMREFTAGFFEKFANSKGKRRWAEKTAHYINHVDTIDRMFKGEVVYIGIARHGLDVAYSLSDFDWGVLKPYLVDGTEKPLASIRFWRDQNRKLLEFRDKVKERFHLVKFEHLTEQPRPVLLSLFQFLDEPWEETILNYNKFEHDPGFEDPKVSKFDGIESNSGHYKKWPLDYQERLFEEARDVFEHFDYRL